MKYFRLALAAGAIGLASITAATPAFAQAGNEWSAKIRLTQVGDRLAWSRCTVPECGVTG